MGIAGIRPCYGCRTQAIAALALIAPVAVACTTTSPGFTTEMAGSATPALIYMLESPTPQASPPGTATQSPLTEATLELLLQPPQASSTPSATPPPIAMPPEALTIVQPGPGSQITSPIRVVGRGGPSLGNRVHMTLYGEDGRIITRRLTYLMATEGRPGRYAAMLTFSIPGIAEAARLEISTDDMRTGRTSHLATVDLVLLSTSQPIVQVAFEGAEQLAILWPRDGSVVSGGQIAVTGAGWATGDLPLQLQVLDRHGDVVGAGEVRFNSPAPGVLGTFSTTITYQVTQSQYGRLLLAEPADSISALLHMNSIELYLRP
jgi:hypothetical protein